MAIKSKIGGLQRAVAKLLSANTETARTAAGDRWWWAVLQQHALADAVEQRIESLRCGTDVCRSDLPSEQFVVLVKEAERLGIASRPDVAAAVLRYRRMAHIAGHACKGDVPWDELHAWQGEIDKASSAALALLLTAEGAVWPGFFPQRPPGEPPPVVLPQWFHELTEAQLVALGTAFILTAEELVDWADELGIPEEERCAAS